MRSSRTRAAPGACRASRCTSPPSRTASACPSPGAAFATTSCLPRPPSTGAFSCMQAVSLAAARPRRVPLRWRGRPSPSAHSNSDFVDDNECISKRKMNQAVNKDFCTIISATMRRYYQQRSGDGDHMKMNRTERNNTTKRNKVREYNGMRRVRRPMTRSVVLFAATTLKMRCALDQRLATCAELGAAVIAAHVVIAAIFDVARPAACAADDHIILKNNRGVPDRLEDGASLERIVGKQNAFRAEMVIALDRDSTRIAKVSPAAACHLVAALGLLHGLATRRARLGGLLDRLEIHQLDGSAHPFLAFCCRAPSWHGGETTAQLLVGIHALTAWMVRIPTLCAESKVAARALPHLRGEVDDDRDRAPRARHDVAHAVQRLAGHDAVPALELLLAKDSAEQMGRDGLLAAQAWHDHVARVDACARLLRKALAT
eukprot:m.90155 g.90155  ORF g.90155 m.90155 type:complete len:431 (-) comp8448_c0_seq1:723-2015(-)